VFWKKKKTGGLKKIWNVHRNTEVLLFVLFLPLQELLDFSHSSFSADGLFAFEVVNYFITWLNDYYIKSIAVGKSEGNSIVIVNNCRLKNVGNVYHLYRWVKVKGFQG